MLIPRLDTPVVVTDGGPQDTGLAARAATRLKEMGYTEVSVLTDGISAWRDAGYEVFSGVNVPSKAFGEFVETYYETPHVSADDLADLQKQGTDVVILDSRPPDEFRRMSIPGGIDCPGAELVYRVGMIAPDPSTTVVVNCAGRTRSIIGAQSLINAGIPNQVMALKGGTMGWRLAGLECAHGQTRHADKPDSASLAEAIDRATKVAARFGVKSVNAAELEAWQSDRDRTTFLLDVRTAEEHAAGHWPGARHAPGGQVVQATDEYIGVRNARVVLADNSDGVRSTMTASWLIQLGCKDVHIITEQPTEPETGAYLPEYSQFLPFPTRISASELRAMHQGGAALVTVDFGDSRTFKSGHIPGAQWSARSRIADWIGTLPSDQPIVITSTDGILAHYAAHDLRRAREELDIRVLEGGTSAWTAAGGEMEAGIEGRNLTRIDDLWWKPYEGKDGVRKAMEDYLTWEVGLVEQVGQDNLVQFHRYD